MANKRRGMLIKNTDERPVEIRMNRRTILLTPGEEQFITSDEVRDPALREKLQIRGISIVRPSTDEEEQELRDQLARAES
ncbi:MAG TPA: hypothetical protein VF190_11935 [Rhodothermales bacterium]